MVVLEIHTYTHVLQCSHASVGLAQAHPNYAQYYAGSLTVLCIHMHSIFGNVAKYTVHAYTCVSMFDILTQPRCDCPQCSILNPPTKSDLACRLAELRILDLSRLTRKDRPVHLSSL